MLPVSPSGLATTRDETHHPALLDCSDFNNKSQDVRHWSIASLGPVTALQHGRYTFSVLIDSVSARAFFGNCETSRSFVDSSTADLRRDHCPDLLLGPLHRHGEHPLPGPGAARRQVRGEKRLHRIQSLLLHLRRLHHRHSPASELHLLESDSLPGDLDRATPEEDVTARENRTGEDSTKRFSAGKK